MKHKGQLNMSGIKIGYFTDLKNLSYNPTYQFGEDHFYILPPHVGPLQLRMSSFCSRAAKSMVIDACMETPARERSFLLTITDSCYSFEAFVSGVSDERIELRPTGKVTVG